MASCCRLLIGLLVACVVATDARGEVIVRWDRDRVPPRSGLGVPALLVPASRAPVVQDAVTQGYRVYLELEHASPLDLAIPDAALAGVVVADATDPEQLGDWHRRLPSTAVRVLSPEPGGTWPHVRLNRVTLRNDVLQVSRPSEQPWVESNGALVRAAERARHGEAPLLAYTWNALTGSGLPDTPALENYLVAIAEAGAFGHDLVLPLHDDFQGGLLRGVPTARADWQEIRQYLDFYSWSLPREYERLADVGVVTAGAPEGYEVLNLLTRHNVAFELIHPADLAGRDLHELSVIVLLDAAEPMPQAHLPAFVRGGGTVVVNAGVSGPRWEEATPLVQTDEHVGYRVGEGRVLERLQPIVDPNAFALDVRDLVGPDRRTLDIWNGITVLAAPYREPDGDTLMLCLVNYAHQPQTVQLRVRGTFRQVHYETPESTLRLVPFRHREGHTEFVLPDLRVGGRVFLSHAGAPE